VLVRSVDLWHWSQSLPQLLATALMLMMWAALIPLENNPIVDDHIIYALLLWVVAFGKREYSLRKLVVITQGGQEKPLALVGFRIFVYSGWERVGVQ
jgi:hypothetical protein